MSRVRQRQSTSHSVSIPLVGLLFVALALGAAGIFWLRGRKVHPWLEVRKDPEGVIVGLQVEPQNIPSEVLARVPVANGETPLRDADQIKALAERLGLYQAWVINPHLAFDQGVVDYWRKQGRPAWELEIQFLSRRLVLEAAERDRARIPSQGDLSRWAERIYPLLLKKAQEKDNSR